MIRPHITLKLATSLDGKIALANGMSEWITGEKSRAAGRRLRAEHDAIAVGANTAVLDNPQLTTRIDGKPDPVRVIFDTHLRLSPDSNLALTAKDNPVWVFCERDTGEVAENLKRLGVTLLPVGASHGLDVAEAVDILKRRNIDRLLVEGGGTLAASFIKLGIIDVIEWFRAPIILGGDGRSGIGDLGLESLDLARSYNRAAISELGDDLHERYERIV
ncbi:MAG: RibD family protein [Alphaproteobacteria bacterium]